MRWRPPGTHLVSIVMADVTRTSRGCPALISAPLVSLPGVAAPEEVLRRPPREAWPLAWVLNALLMKMGHMGPLVEPRRGLQAGKSGDPPFPERRQ